MEKRSWPRKAARFNASLSLSDGNYPCVIRDFSQTGVLASLEKLALSSLSGRSNDQPLTGKLRLGSEENGAILDVELARVTDQGAGLRLLNPSSDHYYALQRAAELTDNSKSTSSRTPTGAGSALGATQRETLAGKANTALRFFLEIQLPRYFDELETALVLETDRQKNQSAQQTFFDAVALMRKQRTRVMPAVINRLSQAVLDIASGNQVTKQPTMREPAASTTLELVDKSDFEDWLVIRVAVSRAESLVREAMIELQMRWDVAFDGKTDNRLFNPFSPASLCHTLFEVIRPLGLKNAALEVVFRVFQSEVLNALPGLYAELNTMFAEAKALPKGDVDRYLAHQMRSEAPHSNRPASARVAEQPASSATSGPQLADQAADTEPTPAKNASAFNVITRLNSLQRRPGHGSSVSADVDNAAELQAPQEDSSELTVQTLAQIKTRLLDTEMASSSLSLRQQLIEAAPAQFVMGERETEALEMIEGLFQSIASSERVADDLQGDLNKLQIPLLRIMLTDPELFNAPAHPARQAMNHLALLVDQDSINLNANRQPIREYIKEVLGSDDDIDGFVQILPGLEGLVLREQRIIERNRQRIREKCVGQQRLIHATRQVERELTNVLDRLVPKIVVDVVEQGWREWMRLAYLRQGAESSEFAGTVAVLRKILLHLQLERDPGHSPTGSASELAEPVVAGLSKVSQGTRSKDELIDSLRELLATGITPTTPMVHYTGAELDSDLLEERLAQQTDTDKNLLRWLKRARALDTGQWFEATSDSAPTQLLQLLWVADDTDQFMFANRQGTRSLALPVDDVAKRLRDGSLEPVHEAALPAVDQGLDALIQKMYDKLAFDSSHDQLTGLQTRKEFSRCLTECIEQARQNSQAYTLIFIDIQQFKVINNTCGYEAGDRFLRELAQRLRSIASTGVGSDTDTDNKIMIGRVGADQFALLLPVRSDGPGYRVAVEIKSTIETNRFVEKDQSFVIHAAIAMLGFDQRNKKGMELLRSVETASELSKRAGSKDIQIVLPGDQRLEELDEVMTWVTRINRALDEDNLKLRCQLIAPLANTDGPKLPHYEVLLTVIDEQGEHIPPAGFIKAAEDFNRMGSVDRWVIETVLRWMMEHPEQLRMSGGFSINLSGHSMNDETFLDFIFDALVRYQVPRDKLVFEITESTAVANLEDAADFISEMRSIGCRFSLDDFGVGQSSYSYLKRLPVDFIKIDGTFIREITTSDVDFALVRSITEMGHYLQKQVVAEYVTNKEILATVTSIGVDYAQGHVHGLPVLLEDLVVTGSDLDPQMA
ncbi:DUF1631 family protein [uncultured Halopseudomonas sp.]|uniref:DUF1631 family protein n=1 Tax=uncultured Halopseudomonas sp. TaxID=2901193 RepID=UPI0030EC696C|tara:strand:+ start:5286 stop:9161 length:3876 start_codon:yes stop_codon:yes gene_type:complete